MSTKVKTGEVRFSFAHLFEPYAFQEGQEAKYSLAILIKKSDKVTIERIKAAYEEAKQEGVDKFGKTFVSKASPLIRPQGSDYGLLKDGDLEDNEEAKGCYIMNLKSNKAPQVLSRETGTRVLSKEEGEEIVYSGCYGKVTLQVYPYSNIRTGISASLNNVFKTKDGERLAGRSSAADDFADELDSVADDDDLL